MSIPPHRVAGEVGHIDDHNAIVDVLTGNDDDIASVTAAFETHETAVDPHGDRAYTDTAVANAIGALEDPPVTSVNGQSGDVILSSQDIGAETPAGAQNKVDTLESTLTPVINGKVDSSIIGQPNGITPLNSEGLIENSYIPSLTGSNKITVTDNPPLDPSDGDIWINTGESSPPPLTGMPGIHKTNYTGPLKIYTAELPANHGDFGAIPTEYISPLVFTTGPTGYTEINTFWCVTNNATNLSTTAISFALSGDGISFEAALGLGAYQSSRGLDHYTPMDIYGLNTFNLPPNTQVTLSPSLRLSTIPDASEQDNENTTGRIFRIDAFRENFYLVKTW